MPINCEIRERYRGALLGLAVGDALGTTVEFCSRDTFSPVTEIVGSGPFRLSPGEWTDDTSMALCLAESLIETRGFDPVDQLMRYARWFREGHLSSRNTCFDIGLTVRKALMHFEETREPYCGSTDPQTAGNGSLMRLAPVPLRWAKQPEIAIDKAGESSRTTHGALTAVDSCRYFAALLVGALHGVTKETLLSRRFSPVEDCWERIPLAPEIDQIASGSFKRKKSSQIESSGYVVHTLEAALWAFHRSSSFEEGCRLAVNLGGDADTTGAVYGQIAGAFYGEQGIPKRWRQIIARRELIESMADNLFRLAIEI
jgi:ADP-ribosyl-[dinitrogen reductase] hydrolase